MSSTGLAPKELALIRGVFAHLPKIERVALFGSRAKGIARPNSDIDVAVYGDIDVLGIEALAMELDELPLPYKFDVQSVMDIQNADLLDHIERAGVTIYEKQGN